MTRSRRFALVIALSMVATSAAAQEARPPAAEPDPAELYHRYRRPLPDDPSDPGFYEPAYRSELRIRPMIRRRQPDRRDDRRYGGRPASKDDARDYGFRNPGGVGRHAEYYPPGNHFQNEGDPVRVAGHDTGVGPSRADQLEATDVGTRRYRATQESIDRYARPILPFGYGFGFGFGGPGFGYGFGGVAP